MNPFRLAGDLSHLLAIIILLVKIWRTRSCAGERTLAFGCAATCLLREHYWPCADRSGGGGGHYAYALHESADGEG